ncbi:MAG: ABC transporter permease [Chitinophagaceae bacterium]
MLKNYWKTAWRNLLKNKASTLINVFGLTLGIAITMLICLWICDELSYNHYHQNHKSLGRILSVETINGNVTAEPFSSVPIANALRQSFPGDFKNISLVRDDNQVLQAGEKSISLYGLWSEDDLPQMLSLKMLQGNLLGLKDASSVLLSKSAAESLFGNGDVLNKSVLLSNKAVVKVAGVYENIPEQSSFDGIDFLIAWTNPGNIGLERTEDWIDHHFQLYVQLNDKVDFNSLSAKVKDITKPHIKGGWEEIQLQPMDKWLLYDKFENGQMVAGRMQFVVLFGIISAFVLLLACINYMNLSTARSEKRAREVGIRKALGSLQKQLVIQFMGESLLLTFASTLIALLVAQLLIPQFNELSGKHLSIPYSAPVFWALLLGFALFTGLIAGSYPSLYLSAFKASKVLKGSFKTGSNGAFARRGLVVLQFTVSITLIICTVVVFKQIQYAKTRPVGYGRERLMTINMTSPELKTHFAALRSDLMLSGAVENVAESSSPSTEVQNSMMGYDWEGRDPRSVPIIGTLFIGEEFGKTIGWHMLEGRDFSKDFPADSGAFILNEAAVKYTGLKNPVGKNIRWHGRDNLIVGVVQDMVMESPYKPVAPVFFCLSPNPRIHVITIRIKKDMPVNAALPVIAAVFKKYDPGNPFEYRFTDDSYSRKFVAEEQIGRIASLFAAFAIFISCLGLFGLASFVAEQRTKEIGVRKILGATVMNIWLLLSKEFVALVTLSMLIAAPLAFWGTHQWLQNYSYRTSLSWWIFAGTGIIALLIALLTVSYQAIKAAIANPVKSLRSE